MKEELRLIKQAIGTLQRAVAILEERLDVDTEKKQNGFKPPEREFAKQWHQNHRYGFSFEDWWNHYESNGWKVGRNSMKDWPASMRMWQSKHRKDNPEVTTVRYDAHGRPIEDSNVMKLL